MKTTEICLFDWGDTLMVDFPGAAGKMCDWPHVEAVAHAKEALSELSRTASIHIATSAGDSTAEDIERAFARVGLSPFITSYFCRSNTGYTKPAPAFYQTIIQRLGAAPGSMTMVGDSLENDILPCRRLGMHTVWFCQRRAEDVPEGVRTIRSLEELLA